MEEEGVIIELKGSLAVVGMKQGGGCEGCGSAGVCHADGEKRVLEADNRAGASVGQRVVIDVDSGAFLKASLIVYMTPVVFLFLGAWLGGRFGPAIMPGSDPDIYQSVGGVLFLVLSVIIVRMYGKWAGRNTTVQPFVARIIG